MKFGGYREVPLKKIIGPGDVKSRQAAPHVVELAADIRELGDEPINAVTAKKTPKGWLLIAGRDRFSALLLNNARTTWVHVVVEATAQELHDVEVSENLYRRDIDRNKLIAERVRQLTARVVAERTSRSNDREVPPAHRPKSAEGEARDRAASQLGMTPEAVRTAERRAEVREGAGPNGHPAQAASAPPPIETFGVTLHAETLAIVVAQQAALRDVEKGARLAVAALKAYGEAFGHKDFAGLLEQAQALGAAARVSMPDALCAYCKDMSAKIGCKACEGAGFVACNSNVPPELLLNGDEACIQVGGALVGVTEYLAGLDAGHAPKKKAATKYDRKPEDCAHAYTDGAKQPGKCSQCGAENTRYRIRNEADDGWEEPSRPKRLGGEQGSKPGAGRKASDGPLGEVAPATSKPKRGMRVQLPGDTEARLLDDVVAEIASSDDGLAF